MKRRRINLTRYKLTKLHVFISSKIKIWKKKAHKKGYKKTINPEFD